MADLLPEREGEDCRGADGMCGLCHLGVKFLGCRPYEYSVFQDKAKLFPRVLMKIYTFNSSVEEM